jgi:hypothetical protein
VSGSDRGHPASRCPAGCLVLTRDVSARRCWVLPPRTTSQIRQVGRCTPMRIPPVSSTTWWRGWPSLVGRMLNRFPNRWWAAGVARGTVSWAGPVGRGHIGPRRPTAEQVADPRITHPLDLRPTCEQFPDRRDHLWNQPAPDPAGQPLRSRSPLSQPRSEMRLLVPSPPESRYVTLRDRKITYCRNKLITGAKRSQSSRHPHPATRHRKAGNTARTDCMRFSRTRLAAFFTGGVRCLSASP